jgi:hypothetical protein
MIRNILALSNMMRRQKKLLTRATRARGTRVRARRRVGSIVDAYIDYLHILNDYSNFVFNQR